MINSKDLSLSENVTPSLVNTVLFKKKIKNIHFNKTSAVIILTLLYVFTKTEPVFAKDADASKEILNYYNYFINFFQTIGFPTIDVFFNLIRMHSPLYTYVKYKTL